MIPDRSKVTSAEICALRRRGMRPIWIGAVVIVASALALLVLFDAETQIPTAGPVIASLMRL
jgi:hypothetical protein